MPQGVHFTSEIKEIYFRVIDFVESEKNGPRIPMNNSTARILTMLGISESSLFNLNKEMKAIRESRDAQVKQEEEKRLRSRSASQIQSTNISHEKQNILTWSTAYAMNTIQPRAPRKIPGRSSIQLSEEADDEIRFQFHLLLAEKIYPTIAILLERLLSAHKDFPVRSEIALWRHIHRLGFTYQRTSKVKVVLDDNSFVAQRACYFRKINELRKADALILFHDETWVNINDEKRSIWIDDSGKGRLRKADGKGITLIILPEKTFMYAYIFNIGTRLGISAMIDKSGFHLPSVDIFDCSKDHSMTSPYFSEWIKKAAFRLREDNGKVFLKKNFLSFTFD